MSTNYYCNNVIINNHNQTKPSYRDVLTSGSDQPYAPKDHSNDKRSTDIGSDAKLLMVSRGLMGLGNESASTSQNGPQEKVVPRNGRKDINVDSVAWNPKWHQNKGKFNPSYGHPKQIKTSKHDFIKRNSIPFDQHEKETKIVKGCSEEKTINPGCNDQKRKEGGTNKGGTDQRSKIKMLPNWKTNPNYKKDEMDGNTNKSVEKGKCQTKTSNVIKAGNKIIDDHLNDSDLDSYTEPLLKSIKSINLILKDLEKINVNQSMKSQDGYSTDDDFRRFVRQPSRKERNTLRNIESLIKKIELFPRSNHTREIKITRLVKQIRQNDMSVLTSSLKRKYLNLKRLLNERKSVSNMRREPYYLLMFNDKDN